MNVDRILVLHPSHGHELRHATARMRWRSSYALYRAARRENVCGYLPPREILSRFQPPRGEVGTIGGFRIIETRRAEL